MSPQHIAVVTYEPPAPAYTGGQLRTLAIIRELAFRHQVRLLCFKSNPDQTAEMARLGIAVQTPPTPHRPQRQIDRIRSLLAGVPYYYSTYDSSRLTCMIERFAHEGGVIFVDQLRSAPALLRANLPKGTITVIDTQNVDTLRAPQLARRVQGTSKHLLASFHTWGVSRFEPRALRAFDRILAVSAQDALAIIDMGVQCERVIVVPNGVDTDHYAAITNAKSDDPTVLFVGSLSYAPNEDAVGRLVHEIIPSVRERIPNARLTVVGSRPSRSVLANCEGKDWVSLHADVPDVRPHLQDAWLVAVPLRAGGGTRLKILEAMAARRPVVSTTLGCQGLDVEGGRHISVADGTTQFVEAIVNLLLNPAPAGELARAGFERVQNRYEWRGIVFALDAALEKAAQNSRRGDAPIAP